MKLIDRVKIWLRKILTHETVFYASCCYTERTWIGAVHNAGDVMHALDNLNCWTCGKFGRGCYGPRLVER